MADWAVVANIRIPSERADAVQVLNQCQALLAQGHRVALYCAWRLFKSPEAERMRDLKAAYGLGRLPMIIQVPCLDLTRISDYLDDESRLSRIIFYLQHLSFLALALMILLATRPGAVLTREIHLAFLGGRMLRKMGIRVVAELHNFPQTGRGERIYRAALARVDGLAVISRGLAQRFRETGLAPARTEVLPDAVSELFFRDLGPREKLRSSLGLPRKGPLVLYCGGLYWAWKGVAELIRAQAGSGERADLAIVGGSPVAGPVDKLKGLVRELGLKKVVFVGWAPPAQIPAYLQAADILVLPNSAAAEISRVYTSPLKLFEYLASGRPVIASDLPSLREVLDENNALLVPPDDPQALGRALVRLADDPALGERLARKGRETARRYTWTARAARLELLARPEAGES